MFSASRFFIRDSFCFVASAATLLVLFLSITAQATAKEDATEPAPAPISTCFDSRLPVLEDRPIGSVALRLAVDREDLLVTVRWPAGLSPSATYVLSTPAGVDVATWPAQSFPGEETLQRLKGALLEVQNLGFDYILELRGSEEVLGWQNFRVTVSCGPGLCVYQLAPGFEGGPLTMSQKLWAAVAEARANGATDLLGHVRENHPELAAEIPGFAWQWQQASAENDGCTCEWVSIQSFSAIAPLGPQSDEPPTHVSGLNMEGAGFFAGVQSIGNLIGLELEDTEGSTSVGLELLCTVDAGGNLSRYPTSWPSLPELAVIEPILDPCPAPCTPVIEHSTEVRGCVQGGATSRLNMPGYAESEMDVGVALDGVAILTAAAQIKVDIQDNELVRKIEFIDKSRTATLNAESAFVELSAGAVLDAAGDLEPDSSNTSYGFAAASMEYRTLLLAPAICGLPQGQAFVDHPLRGSDDGGVTMERWENP